MPRNLLILGGTSEAAELARRIGPNFDFVTSLAGRMTTIPDLPGRLRVGGFGGAEGLSRYLEDEKISAVIDATHPFARHISAHALEACRTMEVPLLTLLRPPWPKEEGDRWFAAADMADAARQLPGLGKRAFLTIGRQEMDAFRDVLQVWFLVRMIDPPSQPLPENWQVILGRPPFDADGEGRLMQEHGIDVLVTKASGGAATHGKILAARQLGLPVLMIERPQTNSGASAASIDEALAWLNNL
ncbi:MAG: cobalt-precorrin-6A reductase [Rhodospirillales bacterium]|nr:cobalt-precorrin-6A reductase [Rhodospirillales bacterium]